MLRRSLSVRVLAAICCVTFGFTSAASAQEWAKKMFKVTKHDFGSVARGAKAEFEFEIQNIYKEDIHIASVSTSCNCTTPSITKDTVKTWEKSSILAKFNTPSFLGQRGATLTVTIDRPFPATVQLQVSGFVRSDVVFDPGSINFGQLDQGTGAERTVKVWYAGRENWNIVDVRSANPNFEVELGDAKRGGGQVIYPMTVRVKKDTPIGFLNDQLTLVSDDVRNQTIPLTVEGRIQSILELSPASLAVGSLKPGESVSKQLVLKSKNKFKVTKIGCESDCFQFKAPSDDEPKALHLIPISFTASNTPGPFTALIRIETDLGYNAECLASGTVAAPEGTAPAEATATTEAPPKSDVAAPK